MPQLRRSVAAHNARINKLIQNYRIMAKDNDNETRTALDEINESLTGLEQKVQNSQRTIMWVILAIGVVVCAILIWIYAIRRPGMAAADNAVGQADITLSTGNDSTALEQYRQVADNYGYFAGNRAALNAAILLYKDGKYEEAAKYLDKYDATESVIGAAAKSLQGDCYVNLDKLGEALGCYDKAIKISDENPLYTPYFMMKKATVLREQKNYSAEAAVYREIIKDYPMYGAQNGIEMEKYLKRAELQAEAGK